MNLRSCCWKWDLTTIKLNSYWMGSRMGYEGNEFLMMTSPNLKLNVGNETILWNKVMKKVKLKIYAGPFREVPFEYFI